MTTLFVGDVHSCSDELHTLIQQVQPTRLILVGDMFNKGPDPDGTWALIRSHQAEAVLGNHDAKVLSLAKKGDLRAPGEALDWLRTLPLMLRGDGWLTVHGGIDPKGPEKTSRKQCLTLRRVPNDRDEAHPFWWQSYQGPPLVIYGHDAIRGLQDHRPHSLGLDTGCVYGGRLTGFVLEEGRLVSVPAQRAYCPIT